MEHADLTQPSAAGGFDGDGWQLTRIGLKNLFFGLGTLGIFWLWGQNHLRSYVWSHITLADSRLQWTGDVCGQKRVISTTARGLLTAIVASTLFSLYTDVQSSTFEARSMVLRLVNHVVIGLALRAFQSFYSWRYQAVYTRLDHVSFALDGDVYAYARTYFRGLMIALCTLGLGYGYFAVTTRRYLVAHSRFGSMQGHYDGDEKQAIMLYIKGSLLTLVSLGAYFPWHIATLRQYHGNHTTVGPLRLRVRQEGIGLSNLWLGNGLIYMFSLGLAGGFARARSLRYQLEHLDVVGVTSQTLTANMPRADDDTAPMAEGLVDALALGRFCLFGA